MACSFPWCVGGCGYGQPILRPDKSSQGWAVLLAAGGPGCFLAQPLHGKSFLGDPRLGKAGEQPGPGGTQAAE